MTDGRLGEGVAAGDVNGDGMDDLALPAPFAPNVAGEKDSGQTYVLLSPVPATVDLASHEAHATVFGVDNGDQLGHVTVVGDLDGDGREDLVLTAVSADGLDNSVDLAGQATVVLSDGLSGMIDVAEGQGNSTVYGTYPVGRLGRSAVVGDIEGDGEPEILLGTPGLPAADGAARGGGFYVLTGAADFPAEFTVDESARSFSGSEAEAQLSTEIFGRTPLAAGDLDGQAGDEIVVAAADGDGPGTGRADSGYALILFISQ
jgi:hypothetical protein